MISAIYFLLYNLIFIPVLFFLSHAGALFHSKLRRGIAGRYLSIKKIRQFCAINNKANPALLIHCASMGEFEHIKPFVRELKMQIPESRIVVMFFSPSGFENVKQFPGVDLFLYSPFDWWLPVLRLFLILKPGAFIVAKHDVWPNQIWISKWLKIPSFLINASLHGGSSRLWPLIRTFQKPVYSGFARIMTISGEDKIHFKKLAPDNKIAVVGDTKYDQVIFRSQESRKKKIIPEFIREGKNVFVAGSTWPEDEVHLIPAIRKMVNKTAGFLAIICPHEPTAAHLQQLESRLAPLPTIRLSEIRNYRDEPVILIDTVGVLANLYSLARVAYVGGSFKQNIHNVLEPAVYGIPVLFGPVHLNSHEALMLKKQGGAKEVKNFNDILRFLQKYVNDSVTCEKMGEISRKLVIENCGATSRMVEIVLKESRLQAKEK